MRRYEAERNGRLSCIKTNELIVADRRNDGYREYRVPIWSAGHVLSCFLRDRTRDTSTSPVLPRRDWRACTHAREIVRATDECVW